jgi:hypothetical protein
VPRAAQWLSWQAAGLGLLCACSDQRTPLSSQRTHRTYCVLGKLNALIALRALSCPGPPLPQGPPAVASRWEAEQLAELQVAVGRLRRRCAHLQRKDAASAELLRAAEGKLVEAAAEKQQLQGEVGDARREAVELAAKLQDALDSLNNVRFAQSDCDMCLLLAELQSARFFLVHDPHVHDALCPCT